VVSDTIDKWWLKNKELEPTSEDTELFLAPVWYHDIKHFALCVAHISSRTVYYLDPLASIKTPEEQLTWFMKKCARRFGSTFSLMQWKDALPRQEGSIDCGAFVAMYAMCLCFRGGRMEFDMSNVEGIRRAITLKFTASHTPSKAPEGIVQIWRPHAARGTTTAAVHDSKEEEILNAEQQFRASIETAEIVGRDFVQTSGWESMPSRMLSYVASLTHAPFLGLLVEALQFHRIGDHGVLRDETPENNTPPEVLRCKFQVRDKTTGEMRQCKKGAAMDGVCSQHLRLQKKCSAC